MSAVDGLLKSKGVSKMGAPLSLGNTVKPPEPVGSKDEIENALQWLARMTRSFAGDTAANEALHVFFEPRRKRFLTPEIATATILELSLPDLVLQFEENGVPSPHAMDVDDKSSCEIEAWLLCEMLHRGFDRDRFTKQLPYKSDHLLSGDERKYAPSMHRGDLESHVESLLTASRVLGALRESSMDATTDLPMDRLLCWPESATIGFISRGRGGAADLKVGYALRAARKDSSSMFFVGFNSSSVHGSELSTLEAVGDALSDQSYVEALSSMMASKRRSAAN